MTRRTIGLIVTLALCLAPLAAEAQPPKKVPRLGYLAPAPRSAAGGIDAFREGLRELGHEEGQTIAIESRFTEGRDERARDLATELVQLGVDVIVAVNTAQALAAKQATSTIPIVFVGMGDLVARGLVTSIARPGGNLTGAADQGLAPRGREPAAGISLSVVHSPGRSHVLWTESWVG
jgi:ABC-type uncharacterized transport system substrate-binding protein